MVSPASTVYTQETTTTARSTCKTHITVTSELTRAAEAMYKYTAAQQQYIHINIRNEVHSYSRSGTILYALPILWVSRP